MSSIDDDGQRHVARTVRHGRRNSTEVVEGSYQGVQRAGRHSWQVPVTAFWQAHRDAARTYSELVGDWARPGPGMTAWDLYGGVGVFAAVAGRRGGGVRAGGQRRQLTGGVAGGARHVG